MYICTHSNGYFVLDEFAKLGITGNLTTRHGFKISTTSPKSEVRVTYDTDIFKGDWLDSALPGSVSFAYTWKED